MEGTIFDSGRLRIFVPIGWKAFLGIDSGGRPEPKKLHIYKSAEKETDIYVRAGITVCYFGRDDRYFSPKLFYDDVNDIAPLVIGGRTFSAYTCNSCGYPYTMLDWCDDGRVLQIMVLEKNGDHAISVSDEDVLSILSGIEVSD